MASEGQAPVCGAARGCKRGCRRGSSSNRGPLGRVQFPSHLQRARGGRQSSRGRKAAKWRPGRDSKAWDGPSAPAGH
eukprot:2973517-Pyramimonas_sp.AAC.1